MDQGQMVAKIALLKMLSTKLPEFGLTEHYTAFDFSGLILHILKI